MTPSQNSHQVFAPLLGCLKKILILARCRIQLHIIWVTAVEETEEAALRRKGQLDHQ